jgi:hypothetical protein
LTPGLNSLGGEFGGWAYPAGGRSRVDRGAEVTSPTDTSTGFAGWSMLRMACCNGVIGASPSLKTRYG